MKAAIRTGDLLRISTVDMQRPDRGSIRINEQNLPTLSERDLGSMDLYDNVAFPLQPAAEAGSGGHNLEVVLRG
ncbi:hypothetical protein AB0M20_09345 [Actinoplanes sp. NPDC051633]|uniref:hypothetical protein n=1 Tax=Actinoplanes sp. NPDC051633 TaxID=3155670 RepID=UPI00344045C9